MIGKILVADDSATIHKIVSLTFAQEEFAVESVLNGNQVLDKALDVKPDVILVDAFIPGLNGYQVCEKIKATPPLSRIPVLLMVGSLEPFDKVEATRVGCNGYLTKPFDTSELIHMVHSVVAQARESDASSPPAAVAAQAKEFPQLGLAMATYLASSKTKESFLGANSILEVFGRLLLPTQEFAEAMNKSEPQGIPEPFGLAGTVPAPADSVIAPGATDAVTPGSPASIKDRQIELSDEALDAIAKRLVQRMSNDVVREVAWEVIPELAEMLIRQWLKEHSPTEIVSGAGKPAEPPPLAC